MTIKTNIPYRLMYSTALKPVEKLVTILLLQEVNCYSSHRLLAEACGCSPKSVMRALRRLRKMNVVTWERDNGRTNSYSVLPSETWNVRDETKVIQFVTVPELRTNAV